MRLFTNLMGNHQKRSDPPIETFNSCPHQPPRFPLPLDRPARYVRPVSSRNRYFLIRLRCLPHFIFRLARKKGSHVPSVYLKHTVADRIRWFPIDRETTQIIRGAFIFIVDYRRQSVAVLFSVLSL